MISRRRFLEVGSVAAGVAATSSSLLGFAKSAQNKIEEQSLPSPIANLKSRKNEATPIQVEERAARLDRARILMTQNAIDAIVLMAGTSLNYFTGIRWWGGERLFAFVLPAKGAAFYVCPAFEEGRAREQIANAPDGGRVDVRTWEEDENPYQLLAQGLKERGVATGKVGIEETVRFFFDDGCIVEGYQSDITRTFVLGKVPQKNGDKMKQVFDIVHRAQAAALSSARPGVECGDVDAAARKVITDAGYGPDYKYFAHRLGHGLGMDGHEWPYLVRGNTTRLAANMTTSNEPGIYIRKEFGIRLEDDMHVTENGAELFTPQSPSLEDPFGKATANG